jgi:hypothetical protein
MKNNKAVTKDVSYWVGEIETYDSQFKEWGQKSKKIVKRYLDERPDVAGDASRFNILWSNIQTLHPAIYAQTPTPNIDRRFDSDDDLGRYSALVLERSVSYFVKNDMFDKVMKQTTLDRLLCGRGVAWVRYCPKFTEQKAQITDDAESKEDDYELESEDTIPDYVHWCDFGHTWARTWQEVRGVWRKVLMTRAELVKRFGEEIGNKIPLDADIVGKNKENINKGTKATIFEIWDKSKKEVVWLHKEMADVIEKIEDPLGLKDFFPCPEPIYSTLGNDTLIPTPDYIQYQDQAMEMDSLTARISALTKAVKVVGVYDSSAQGIDRMLSEGVENKLIPVDSFAMLGDGKGLQGVISYLPMVEIMQTLQGLYQAREQVKQDLYEITGISDIVRGQTSASETATAQQIKGQFATLRLDNNQKDVARFSKDLVVIMTEIIANHFSMETIKMVSGVKLLTAQEKQMIQMQQAQQAKMTQSMQAQGGQPQPPQPLPEEVQELMNLPTWDDIEALIRNDTARAFRIDIETDSTIKTDQENEKQMRIEFLGAVSGFMQQAMTVPPELRTLSMEMLMFGIRGFKVSREIETSFETAMREIRKAEDNPQPEQPDPEALKAQAEQQRTQAMMQLEQMKHQNAMQLQQAKSEADDRKINADMRIKEIDAQIKQMDLRAKEIQLEQKRIGSIGDIVNV